MGAARPDERTSGPGRVRAGDDDRTRVATLLAENYAQGRLDHAEFDERSSHALTAVYLDELDVLIADLPGGATRRQPATRPSPRPLPWTPRAAPHRPLMALFILAFLALVVLTRGAALWVLPLLWLVGGPARFDRRRMPRSGAAYGTGPAAWRTGPPCRRWSAPVRRETAPSPPA